MGRSGEVLQTGFWGNVDPKVKKWVVIGATVFVVGGVSTYYVRKAIRKSRADKILKEAIHDGTLPSIVEKIYLAVDGAGTDEEKVYEAYSDIPTQVDVDRVGKLYNDAYGETIDSALTGDLGTEEMQTVKNITAGKPKRKGDKTNYNLLDSWVQRLKEASGFWSTDEDKIYRVLWEVPDKNGYSVLSNAIATNNVNGYKSLSELLTAQLGEGEEQDHARYIMARKK